MSRVSEETMKKERGILMRMLKENADRSIDAFAKALGFSRQKVWRMKNSIDGSDDCWGYGAVIDDKALGMKRFIVRCKQSIDHSSIADAKKFIYNLKRRSKHHFSIEDVYLSRGSYVEWVLIVTAVDDHLFHRTLQKVIDKSPLFFSDVEVITVMESVMIKGISIPNIDELFDYFTVEAE